jgi:hypothetical protein
MKSSFGKLKGTLLVRALLPLVVAASLQCSGESDTAGPSTTGTSCERVDAKLRYCTLVSPEGYTGCIEPQTEGENCQNECLIAASCDHLTTAFCDPTKESTTSPLAQCFKACDAHDAFACKDGQTVPKDFVCDGEPDCPEGEDEMGCDLYCPDGDAVPRAYHCDGINDCSDGSDETNCPATPPFTCDNGESIPIDLRCDGKISCSDSSDEHGCAKALCPTSETAVQLLPAMNRLQKR